MGLWEECVVRSLEIICGVGRVEGGDGMGLPLFMIGTEFIFNVCMRMRDLQELGFCRYTDLSLTHAETLERERRVWKCLLCSSRSLSL